MMIFNKIKYFLPLLEKMPIGFFNISRSIAASLSFHSNSLIVFCFSVCLDGPFPGKLPISNFS